MKNAVDTPCESNINTLVEEHFLPEKNETFCYCCHSSMIKYYQPVSQPLE